LVQCLADRGVTIVGSVSPGERRDLSNSLLELTAITDKDSVEAWNARLFELVEHQSDRRTANQVFHIVGEVLGNALSHGRGPIGAFAVAQYYTGKTSLRPAHIEVAVADGGRGILDHLSEVHAELSSAHEAIELSLREGVSGVADPSRGHGLDEVDTVGRKLGGQILIRSTDGVGRIEFAGRRPRRSFVGAPQSLPGTWVHLDLDLPNDGALGADRDDVLSLKQ
jgi:hypothetical protein